MTTIIHSPGISQKKIKLNRYAGQWAAFVKEQIIAHNETLKGLIKD